eukprot:CAMPEP_0202055780 /NCGR_PEP_ID=MMETSP0963-20130614/20402_1 /ASSEMBLY_ACC=CAM_ASM_000494 /TAXON_ID=4773 /ORGANISM="Schizochytrium aggregatum, Strain ATCC28209" /LENGTH=122 /DNA_ID=CAMNT_0048621421 /DNA_START=512 /DNA_END=877 /DNA_ORIENTATION=-
MALSDAARAPGRSAASNASEANERDTTIAQGAQTELLRATARGSGSRRGARAEDGAIGGWRRACPTCRAGPAPPDGLPPGLAHPHAEVVARGPQLQRAVALALERGPVASRSAAAQVALGGL